jgi:hypothetical protein
MGIRFLYLKPKPVRRSRRVVKGFPENSFYYFGAKAP